jgi:hypothetical protein
MLTYAEAGNDDLLFVAGLRVKTKFGGFVAVLRVKAKSEGFVL